ncbi:uncharacterized protein BP5553_03210 [Venustampulla echinocandica]|uniref:Zn(2)-C6 fungal-type domain-containing protein n=1 Tax=Venustampulla echinocandica TaxID=2656787 RepID=A0A370TTM4_9HELO|nr:uncharacterized protein BP5553_03210 [Venustampulla echinocandica]RDL38870.1 hypothetical protein BP5553_03210 [Venustampulla echinocandica]
MLDATNTPASAPADSQTNPPTTPGATTAQQQRMRSRAKKACKTCNSRRVKCNVMEEQPCKNCRTASIPCELMKSRRGKYERHPKHTRSGQSNNNSSGAGTTKANGSLPFEAAASETKHDHATYTSPSMSMNAPGKHKEETAASPIFHITPPSPGSTQGALNGADGADTVFLGESNSISLVHTAQSSAAASHHSPTDKLRYPIPAAVSSKTSTLPFESRRKAARIDYLTQDGAFSFPSNDVCEVLFEAYFSWFHPCFPVLDRYQFFNSYITNTLSPILFQAVLFVGASHCNGAVMRNMGYSDRQEARNTLYNRAKDIYDADYETDKITVSQALFLMSFWRAGPLLEKDTRHWLGAAISLAQTKGMHRSSSSTSFANGKLRKRIWWSLYVRDRQCSAALGLPTRIRDEDCDIEMLDPSDFEEEDHSAYPRFLGTQKREHILYAIQMAKLAVYRWFPRAVSLLMNSNRFAVGKVVLREFTPIKAPEPDSERSKLKDNLINWESELSPEMRASATASSFWASMLHLSYNNLYILLYRSAYLRSERTPQEDLGDIALQAACRNTRIIEDVLSQDLVQHSNVHVTTSLFNSLCIHTICLRRSKDTARKLAEYRAQLCLLGLRELQKTWDVTNWVLQLFFQFLDQTTAKKLLLAADNEDPVTQHQSTTGTPRATTLEEGADPISLDFDQSQLLSAQGYAVGKSEELARNSFNLDFASHLFGTKEAEDFSMFQLQPDLFSGDVFGGGLDQYYHSVLPRSDGMGEDNQFR